MQRRPFETVPANRLAGRLGGESQADVRPCDINVENISPALIVQTVDNLARKTLISGSETIPADLFVNAFNSLKMEVSNQ